MVFYQDFVLGSMNTVKMFKKISMWDTFTTWDNELSWSTKVVLWL